MKKALMFFGVIFTFCVLAFSGANAQDTTATGSTDGQSQGVSSRQEEKQLLDQIRTAEQSGDTATARQLRKQLKSTHQDNVQQRQQDVKEARQEGAPPPRRDNDNNPPGPRGGPGTNLENRPGPQGGHGGGGRR